MGKWIAFIVAIAAGLIVFLVYRKTAKAATSGAANTTGAPAGATAGGALATLTAPPTPEGFSGSLIEAPPTPKELGGTGGTMSVGGQVGKLTSISSSGSVSLEGTKYVKRPTPKPATSVLPPVGTGTVVPAKPATQALPAPPKPTNFAPTTVFGGFSSFSSVGVGQSFYVTPKAAPAPPPPPPAATSSAPSTKPKFSIARAF